MMKEVGDMLGRIGCAFRELGRHNEALRMMERALDFRRRTLHKNHPDIATSMGLIPPAARQRLMTTLYFIFSTCS